MNKVEFCDALIEVMEKVGPSTYDQDETYLEYHGCGCMLPHIRAHANLKSILLVDDMSPLTKNEKAFLIVRSKAIPFIAKQLGIPDDFYGAKTLEDLLGRIRLIRDFNFDQVET